MTNRRPHLATDAITRRGALAIVAGTGIAAGIGSFPFGRARAEEPKRGGTLRIGSATGSTSSSLDPTTYTDQIDYVKGLTLGNTLVRLDEKKQPQPELATDWESSDNAQKWVFTLRDGVEFHDGRPLTVEDAVWSLRRHMGEASTSPAKTFLEDVTEIRADGDKLVIELAEGNAGIPSILGQFQFVITPKGHTDFGNFIGTGPYRLEENEQGVRFLAARNENYWKEDAAWVDRVEMTVIADSTARVNALMTGEVDFIDRIDNRVVQLLGRNPLLKVLETPDARYFTFAMDVRIDPFTQRQVRNALKWAIDRQEIIDKVLAGHGTLGNDQPVPPSDPMHNPNIPQRTYDPERAKALLKEVGMENLAVPLSAAEVAFTGSVEAAQLYQASAAAADIAIDVVQEPNDGYWSNVWLKKPFVAANWLIRPTPPIMFSQAWACGAEWNDTSWCNQAFMGLLKKARTETDFDARKQLIWEMQEIAHEDGGNVLFAFASLLDAYHERVRGLVPHLAAPMVGGRMAETVWLES